MTHSPGPWFYRPREFDDGGIVRRADGQLVAEVITHRNLSKKEIERYQHDCIDPCEADGHLIEAAPEMLEALEEIEALIRESSGVTGWHLNGQVAPRGELDLKVGAVLRKARGEA